MKISPEALEVLRKVPVRADFAEAARESIAEAEPLSAGCCEDHVRPSEVFRLADVRLDLTAVQHLTPGLQELADSPIENLSCGPSEFYCWDEGEEISECDICRLVIVIGDADESIRGARAWALKRAKEWKGCFQLWKTSTDNPFRRLFVKDIQAGNNSGEFKQYTKDGGVMTTKFSKLLPNLAGGKGRIDELVVFHHGAKVKDEDQIVVEIGSILATILKIPVCRIAYWSCNAAVELNTARGGAVDEVMRAFARLSHEQQPCGCGKLVELLKPTAGKCAIKDSIKLDDLSTGDGMVKRTRWGYLEAPPKLPRQLRPDPDPNDPHPFLNPQPGEEATVEGEKIMGAPVVADPGLGE